MHKLHHPLLHIYKEKTRAHPGLGRGQRILDYAYLKEKREREEREEEEGSKEVKRREKRVEIKEKKESGEERDKT